MKLIDMKCPHCAANLQVDSEKGQATCTYCGATILIDNEVQHVQYDNAEEAGYKFEKGRQRAQAEARRARSQSNNQQNRQQPKKKRRTWLWVIGWICIFPLPLTILLLRKKDMKPILKYGIIAAGWIFYLLIAFSGSSGSNDKSEPTRSRIQSDETTVSQSASKSTSVQITATTTKKENNIADIVFYDTADVSLKIGKTQKGTATITLKDSATRPNEDVELISDNPSIATISSTVPITKTGIIYEIKANSAGETTVYVSSKDGSITSKKIKVIVSPPVEVERITLSPDEANLAIGETLNASAVISPEDAENKDLTWISDDESIVKVDKKGKIVAVGGGTTKITASAANGTSASMTINVDTSKQLMVLKVSHPRDDDNNIGHEWSYLTEINGEHPKNEYVVSVGDKLSFYAKFTETDDNPDIGEATKSYTVTEADVLNGFTVTMDLYVKENGGRNSGKSAHFIVTFDFATK